MLLSSAPSKMTLPFANAGNKNTIPVASSVTPGLASYTDGFPASTMTPISAGGVPPSGKDFNGVLNAITAAIRWWSAGGSFTYDATFAADVNVGGYPAGARLLRSDGTGFWLNTVDNNATAPESGGAGWVPSEAYGITAVALTNANVTLTSLQGARDILSLSGTLTANVNLILPAYTKQWLIVNNCTGAFTVTVKYATGTGVASSPSTSVSVFGNGTNIALSNVSSSSYLPLTGGSLAGGINYSLTTVASATTPDIWTNTGNLISMTGTTTVTGFANAPQAGSSRRLVMAGTVTFTNGANLLVQGGADYTSTAGDVIDIEALTTTRFRLVIYPANGLTPVAYGVVPVRNTVMSGDVNANGNASILSVGSGLTPSLLATTTPVRVALAAGFGSSGQIDYVGMISADALFPASTPSQTVSSATNAISCVITTAAAHGLLVGSWVTLSGFTPTGYNGTYQVATVGSSTTFTITLAAAPGATTVIGSYTVANFLYVDRNASTGALTLGTTVQPPDYQYTTASTTNGKHTFVIPDMKMYIGNGVTVSAVQRVFVGEANAGAAAISSTVSYAFNRKFDSAPVTITAVSTKTNYNANIGTKLVDAQVYAECVISEAGYSVGDRIVPKTLSGTQTYPYPTIVQRNQIATVTAASVAIHDIAPSGVATNLTPANWRVGVSVKGSF